MRRRRIEEIDEDGRRRTVITEEPSGHPDRPDHDLPEEEAVSEEEEVVHSRANPWEIARGWVRTIGIWAMVALAIVETLLVFRLGFLLAGANSGNGFVDFIYDISRPLVDPFEGIVGNRSVDGGVLEPATVIAMAVYLVAAILLVAVLWAATAGSSPTGERSVTSRSRRRASAVRD